MSGIDSILKKIDDQTDEACSGILSEARSNAEFSIAEAVNAAEQEAAAKRKQSEASAQTEYARIVSSGQSEARKLLLAKKQELVDRAFSEALMKLQSLAGEELKTVLIKMISSTLHDHDEIILPQSYQNLVKDLEDHLKNNLDFAGGITLSPQLQSGFVLKRGGVEINKTFGALIRQYREDLEPEVVTALFFE